MIQELVTAAAHVRDLDRRPLDAAPTHTGMLTALSVTNAGDAQALTMDVIESARSALHGAAETLIPIHHLRGENATVVTEHDRLRRTWNKLTSMHLWLG